MEFQTFVQHQTGQVDVTGVKLFGEYHTNPEGVYETAFMVHPTTGQPGVGFAPTKAAQRGENQDKNLHFHVRSVEPGFEGAEFGKSGPMIYLQAGTYTPPPGTPNEDLNTFRISRDKTYSALLAVGWTEQEAAQILHAGLDHTNVVKWFTQSPSGGRMTIKVSHSKEESKDKQTNQLKKLKNGAQAHFVQEDYMFVPWRAYKNGDYAAFKPNKAVKSVAQQEVDIERAIGLADAGTPAPSAGNFAPAGTPTGYPSAAAVNSGMVPPASGGVPATPPAANPFQPQGVPPTTAVPPGYAAGVPNGSGSPLPGMPGAPVVPGLAGALPPQQR